MTALQLVPLSRLVTQNGVTLTLVSNPITIQDLWLNQKVQLVTLGQTLGGSSSLGPDQVLSVPGNLATPDGHLECRPPGANGDNERSRVAGGLLIYDQNADGMAYAWAAAVA